MLTIKREGSWSQDVQHFSDWLDHQLLAFGSEEKSSVPALREERDLMSFKRPYVGTSSLRTR
jgi:hypothetical protein